MPAPRLLTHAGETLPIAAWAARLGIKPAALRDRLRQHDAATALTMRARGERHDDLDAVSRRSAARLAAESLALGPLGPLGPLGRAPEPEEPVSAVESALREMDARALRAWARATSLAFRVWRERREARAA